MNTGNAVVDQFGTMAFEGNIVPPSWYRHIRFPEDKRGTSRPDPIAVTLLADIVYWYRPYIPRDESTGMPLSPRKKFAADKLQRSYGALAEQFGFTKRQVTDAMHRLADAGLITLEFRNIMAGETFCSNVLYVEPCPERIAEITYRHDAPEGDTSHAQTVEVSRSNVTPPTPKRETYTKTSSKTSTETSEELPAAQEPLEEKELPPHQDMFGAICEVTKADPKLRSIQGRVARLGKEMREAGYTAADVRRVFGDDGWWYKEHWKGKRGECPHITELVTEIQKGLSWRSPRDQWAGGLTENEKRLNEIAFRSLK